MIVVMVLLLLCYAIGWREFYPVSVKGIRWEREASQNDAKLIVAFDLVNSRKKNFLVAMDILLYRQTPKGGFYLVGQKQVAEKLAAGETKAMKEALSYLYFPTALVDSVQVRVVKVSKI